MKIIKNKYLNQLFLIPFFVILLFPLLIFAVKEGSFSLFLSYIISIIIPFVIINIIKINPFNLIWISFPFFFIAVIYTVVVFEYQTDVNVNTWEVLLNSNKEEASEFFNEIKAITFLFLIIQFFTYITYFIFFIKVRKTIFKRTKRTSNIAFIIAFFLLVDFGVKGATKKAFPISFSEGLIEYIYAKYKEKKYLNVKEKIKLKTKRSIFFKEDIKETIIVVIGESLRRDNLEYYGYNKATTPNLKKENLICYTDVVSPANQSVNSIKRVFSLAELDDENGYLKYPTFIKAFKEVGFKTHWISTQSIFGIHDSEISYIAKETDNVYFMNNNFDEILFEPYEQLLDEKANKKMIFIHLMGSHASYSKRTPKMFKHFSKNKSKSKNKKENKINLYDDTVRYNDYILSFFLNKLKEQEGEKTFLMFSDHGESLYDSGDNLCFHGSTKPSKSEYNIPFILWFSDEFKKNHSSLYNQVILNKNKAIILSDFFHSMPSLYGLEFLKKDKSKNFFSKEYISSNNRKVLNGRKKLLNYNDLPNKIIE